MYKTLKIYNNIEDFSAELNKGIVDNTVIDLLSNTRINSLQRASSIKVGVEYYIILDDLNKPSFFNLTNEYNRIPYDFRVNTVKDGVVGFYKKGENKLNGLYEYAESKILFETTEPIGKDIFSDKIFNSINSKITARNALLGNVLWDFDISNVGCYTPFLSEEEKPGEVKNFVGVYNNQLIVLLTGGKLIGLNVGSGELLWEQNKVQVNHTNQIIDYNFGDPYHCFLDQQTGLLYILQGEAFIVFDINTRQASYKWHIKNEPAEEYLFIRQSRLYGNYIYFTGFRKSNEGNDDTIGVFDIAAKKIVWHYTLLLGKANFIPNSQHNIQLNDTHLYVLDAQHTLHVFEKLSS